MSGADSPAPGPGRSPGSGERLVEGGVRPGICTLGDVLLDVIVEPSAAPVPDGDVPAVVTLTGGGQAANVAAWAAALGSAASVVTRLGRDESAVLATARLHELGVVVHVCDETGRTGSVVSVVRPDGSRTMMSDRDSSPEIRPAQLRNDWLVGHRWLHISGHLLLAPGGDLTALRAAATVLESGGRVSVDVASASLVTRVSAAEARRRISSVQATVVFANRDEAAALGELDVETVIVKRAASGATVTTRSGSRALSAPPVSVRDTTGAGDAFAAGWLVGGDSIALAAAAACVGCVGSLPPPGWSLDTSIVSGPSA